MLSMYVNCRQSRIALFLLPRQFLRSRQSYTLVRRHMKHRPIHQQRGLANESSSAPLATSAVPPPDSAVRFNGISLDTRA